ncbi:unnamed protein product [Rotaria sp. Silwood2]|nr:unnamed protein product [Rotaria sp. Silwood2]
MPHLHTFHFDIVTEYVRMNEQQLKPTPDDIRRTFTERGYHVDCYIDYGFYNSRRCHVYSIPFDNERMCHITHGFPGVKTNVTHTIGAEFGSKIININQKNIKLQI